LLQERGERLAILVNREGEGQQPLDMVVHCGTPRNVLISGHD
jgi:hypothetical protein